ncbi:SgcJ/EcaC family oxidoreductase [Micromonospora sp. WMMA1363]|uniref:SgcJ/EcaC family oxidoreductase n=1 Tax=Micromonospora sp. WMMA1363 TaxID=3053985 RepID=UPI00259D1988|nr:SgcJ/EcaC family oxidoreductase [Micromonospora sp. WMMA1363]MDM4719647.1 SgcJ/EcaC family oxidoreductase [Micromonospora sp. WMMA1363]
MTTTGPLATPSSSDQVGIASLTQKVMAAWAYHDADGFADLFVEDGTMILAGVYRNGREEIREYLTEAYQGRYKGTQVTGKPLSVRSLGPDSAVLLSYGGVLEPGESEVSSRGAVRASWVVVKRDGEWRLAAYQNTPANTE